MINRSWGKGAGADCDISVSMKMMKHGLGLLERFVAITPAAAAPPYLALCEWVKSLVKIGEHLEKPPTGGPAVLSLAVPLWRAGNARTQQTCLENSR